MNDEYHRNSSKEKDQKLVVFYVEAYENKEGGLREAGGIRDTFKRFVACLQLRLLHLFQCYP